MASSGSTEQKSVYINKFCLIIIAHKDKQKTILAVSPGFALCTHAIIASDGFNPPSHHLQLHMQEGEYGDDIKAVHHIIDNKM